jgi:hypothetical protein
MVKKIIWLTLFAIAMAYFESTTVIYLRNLYYPEGFTFPLKIIPINIALIEMGRETATILILISVAILLSQTRGELFTYFMYCFGVWDIFYYIWLRLLIDWPPSLLTWDVLFLIPVSWVGPVLAPIIVSLTLVAASMIVICYQKRGCNLIITRGEWSAGVLAGFVIFLSFIMESKNVLAEGVPVAYPWWMLITGEIVGIGIFIRILRKRTTSNT